MIQLERRERCMTSSVQVGAPRESFRHAMLLAQAFVCWRILLRRRPQMIKRSIRAILLIGIAASLYPVGADRVFGTTFYISTSGSDVNGGINKEDSWQHAPGMPNCSDVCSTITPKPGDRFIFRGQDTWHTSVGSVRGMPWRWTWSGTNTDHVYIGVDKAWFSGSSWARPILHMDNPLSTERPESCSYDDTDLTGVSFENVSYVDFDGFEFIGKCWSGSPRGASIFRKGSHITISNSYFHGWTMTAGAGNDNHYMILGAGSGVTGNVIASNVFDGSDSSLGAAPKEASGFAIYAECYDVHRNVFRRLSNGAVCSNPTYVHDNLFELMYNPVERQFVHGNVVESLGGLTEQTTYFYNNLIRHTEEGVTIWLQATVLYVFNNVFYDVGNPTNCLMQNPVGLSAGTGAATSYVYNNTFEWPCHIHFYGANATTPSWSGPVYFANNNLVGYSSVAAVVGCRAAKNCYLHDQGGNVHQSRSQAKHDYTSADDYTAASKRAPTVNQGLNLSAMCGSIAALCSTTSLGVIDDDARSIVYPAIPIRSRPRQGPWDAGAY